MPLSNVESLSDEDAGAGSSEQIVSVSPPAPDRNVAAAGSKRRLPGDRSIVSSAQASALRVQLSRTVQSRCRCCKRPKSVNPSNCFSPFREQGKFDEIFRLRQNLLSISKEDADKKVF